MKKVEKLNNSTFKIISSPDNSNTPNESSHKMWFYFSINGMYQDQQITFMIENINTNAKIYRDGHRPVYKNENNKWK